MRKNSKRQTEASRKNGAKSKGPTSARGKQISRMNALKDGIFSKQVVVTAAGERVQDYTRFKEWAWASIQPDGAIEEILTMDIVDNYWGRQRVRRCRSAALESHLENFPAQDFYLRSDEIEPVKLCFQLLLEGCQSTMASTPPGDINQIVIKLENARSLLASTRFGVEFLMTKVDAIKREAESTGQMSSASEVALRACAGFMDDAVRFAIQVNRGNQAISAKAAERAQTSPNGGAGQTKEKQAQQSKDDQSGGKKTEEQYEAEQCRAVLVSAIESIARQLGHRKQQIEKSEGKARWAAAVLLDDDTYERFERAEAPCHRGLYRAMGALQAIRQDKDASKILGAAFQGEIPRSKK
jgi:hypothetical protein